jgi:CheY-specific phosphatase CheX
MAIRFFGQYLLAEGLITAQQLIAVVEQQELQNLKLGEFAVRMGYLSDSDAARVNRAQLSEDIQFGTAAVRLGLLSDQQVEELIATQRANHAYFGEIVVDLGFASRAQVDAALVRFRRDQAELEAGNILIPDEVPTFALVSDLFDITSKMLLRYWGLRNKPSAVQAGSTELSLGEIAVEVSLYGDVETRFFLGAPLTAVREGAKRVLKINMVREDECRDLTGELANIVCGNLVTRFEAKSHSIKLSAPTVVVGAVDLPGELAVEIELETPFGTVRAAATYKP